MLLIAKTGSRFSAKHFNSAKPGQSAFAPWDRRKSALLWSSLVRFLLARVIGRAGFSGLRPAARPGGRFPFAQIGPQFGRKPLSPAGGAVTALGLAILAHSTSAPLRPPPKDSPAARERARPPAPQLGKNAQPLTACPPGRVMAVSARFRVCPAQPQCSGSDVPEARLIVFFDATFRLAAVAQW